MSYDTSTVVQSRVRPGNQQVELSLALNSDGPNFDVSKGEQMALNVDGCEGKPGKRGGGGVKENGSSTKRKPVHEKKAFQKIALVLITAF